MGAKDIKNKLVNFFYEEVDVVDLDKTLDDYLKDFRKIVKDNPAETKVGEAIGIIEGAKKNISNVAIRAQREDLRTELSKNVGRYSEALKGGCRRNPEKVPHVMGFNTLKGGQVSRNGLRGVDAINEDAQAAGQKLGVLEKMAKALANMKSYISSALSRSQSRGAHRPLAERQAERREIAERNNMEGGSRRR